MDRDKGIAGTAVRPTTATGRMGRPLPGIEAAVVTRDEQAEEDGAPPEPIEKPMIPGELALKLGWPSMLRGYLHNEARYKKLFAGDWFLTGDLVARARAGRLRSSEMTGPTLTVSSLGERGVEALYGVIYPPQVALVGFAPLPTAACRGRGARAALVRHGHAGRRPPGQRRPPRSVSERATLPPPRDQGRRSPCIDLRRCRRLRLRANDVDKLLAILDRGSRA